MPRKPHVRPTMPMVTRAVTLREAGLTSGAIEKVLVVDFGESPCKDYIRKLCRQNGCPPAETNGRPTFGKVAA